MGLLEPHGRGGRPGRQARLIPRIVIHSLEQARAALEAARELDEDVILESPAEAASYLGPLWFKALLETLSEEAPEVEIDGLLDCGDAPGHVLAAFRAGIHRVRFTGSSEMRQRLQEIGESFEASVEGEPQPSLDLLNAYDPAAACRAFLDIRPSAISGSEKSRS